VEDTFVQSCALVPGLFPKYVRATTRTCFGKSPGTANQPTILLIKFPTIAGVFITAVPITKLFAAGVFRGGGA
jgi:hypothetical protein